LYERSRSNALAKGKVKTAHTLDQAEQLKSIREFVSDLSWIVGTVNTSMHSNTSMHFKSSGEKNAEKKGTAGATPTPLYPTLLPLAA